MTETTIEERAVSEADSETNDFRAWMKSLGFNAKQVSTAGDLVGMSSSLAGHSSRGLRELTKTERLAMAAATAGLPEWEPGAATDLEAVRTIYMLLKDEIGQAKSGSGSEADALRTIRAVIRAEALRIATEARLEKTEDPEGDQAILALLRAAAQRANVR